MARFVGNTLDDPQTFTPEELVGLKSAVAQIIENFDRPDVSGHGSPHYLLTEMAVWWCLAHPAPISRVDDRSYASDATRPSTCCGLNSP